MTLELVQPVIELLEVVQPPGSLVVVEPGGTLEVVQPSGSVDVVQLAGDVVEIVGEVSTVDVVEVVGHVLEVVQEGPQGPPGGPGGEAYVHTQSAPATTWTINHNLGYRPTVEVLSVGGIEIDADVRHTNGNQTLIHFNVAAAGTARLI